MSDTERALISNLALNIMSGTLDAQEIYADAKQMYEISQRPDWTPCAEGLPTEDGFYMVTIRIDNVLQHGEYESRVELDGGRWCQISSDMEVVAWRKESPYRADHIRDDTKKVDQFREPTEMMLAEPVAHDKKAPPAKWCCGKPPIARYHESEIGLSRAFHTIKCQVCHSGVQVDIENYTDEAYDAAFKHAVELWNEKVQHRPPMNTEICLPRTEEAE